jgi:hypothetical protein
MFRPPLAARILFKEEVEREIEDSDREQQGFWGYLSINSRTGCIRGVIITNHVC